MENDSKDRVALMLSYNPATGELKWTSHPQAPKNGNLATRLDKHGHATLRFMGKTYMAHRFAWKLHYGNWPVNCIDHINGVRNDNRIENLRDVSLGVNQQNRKGRTVRNKYDCPMGVTFYKTSPLSRPWIAGITPEISRRRSALIDLLCNNFRSTDDATDN